MESTRHVLFLSHPDENHRYLTLAVAEELGRRGHRVTFATGDSFAEEDAEAGVLVLRYGRSARAVRRLPAFVERARAAPVDLVVCDPRTHDDAQRLGLEWGVPVVVAHTNLAPGEAVDWPAERSFGADYVYVHPTGRGAPVGGWTPTDPRHVLAVLLADPPVDLLARAFRGAPDWQLVSATDPRDHADVALADGDLPGIAAALRHGTPLVLTPRTPEQRRHAERVAVLGLGVVVPSDELGPATLRRAARAVRALLRAAGSPARVSDVLEARLATGLREVA